MSSVRVSSSTVRWPASTSERMTAVGFAHRCASPLVVGAPLACAPVDGARIVGATAEPAQGMSPAKVSPSATVEFGASGDGNVATSDGLPSSTASAAESTDDSGTSGSVSLCPPPQAGWRSVFYPEDWSPDVLDEQGRALPDVSYAGYNAAQTPLPDVTALHQENVVDFGADPSGMADASAAVQAAISAIADAGGGVVWFPAGTYRLDNRLDIRTSYVVLAGERASSSRIYFTGHDGMDNRAHIAFQGILSYGHDVPLAQDAAARSLTVTVTDTTTLNVGDHVALGWTISDAFVDEHGMTGTWTAFSGQWKPFFLREITGIDRDANVVTLDVPIRYVARLRDDPSIRVVVGYLRDVGVQDLAVANSVPSGALDHNQVRAITFDGVRDAWVSNVESWVSPLVSDGSHLQSGGISIVRSKRVTVSGTTMQRAQNRGEGGNGYLFEISRSNEVLIADSRGVHGRHNFIQNWDFGTSGCVFLRCHSSGGNTGLFPTYSEFHHSLAMANLVDSCTVEDGWSAVNRGAYSSGAGTTATETVFWNVSGGGVLRSTQWGHGYVIGSSADMALTTDSSAIIPPFIGWPQSMNAPDDWVEQQDGPLAPSSLYDDQLARRLGCALP